MRKRTKNYKGSSDIRICADTNSKFVARSSRTSQTELYWGSLPIQVENTQNSRENIVNLVVKEPNSNEKEFENYLMSELAHLNKQDRYILEPVLRQYKHLFYGLGNAKLGCTSQVEHSIDTGGARPVKKNLTELLTL